MVTVDPKPWDFPSPTPQRSQLRSGSCFGSRSASWLGLWFELCAFTCIATAITITNTICTLRSNILFLLHGLTHAWLQRAFPKYTHMNHTALKELCKHKSSDSGFLGRFKSPIWKSFVFTKGKIRLSNQERVRITIQNGFQNVIRSFANRSKVCVRTW